MEIPLIDFWDEEKADVAYKLLCNACLCVGRTLHEVADEKMSRFYLDTLREIPLCEIPVVTPSICWECKASLKKAVAFKEQVQDSYRILQTYTNETLHECLISDIVRSSRLQTHTNSPISFNPENVEERGMVKESVYVKGELKIEVEVAEWSDEIKQDPTSPDALSDLKAASDSESEQESVITRTKVKKKKKNRVQSNIKRAEKIAKHIFDGNKTSKKFKNTADKKFLTIELSYDEMLSEREKEASKESYIKAEFKCESCLLGFNYRRSFKVHNQTKHATKLGDYICPVCKSRMSSVESFTAHYKRHMRRYECSICQKRTMDVKVMQQHYYSTHEIALKEYKCNLCGKISNSIDTHRYHKDTHKARVQCNKCDKTFSHRGGLLNHRLSAHELRNTFPCTECDKVFRWKTSLRRHMAKNHVKDKPAAAAAYCGACGVSFASACSYQRHLKNSLKHVTQDQLRYICDHCNRRYSDKTKLRDHIEEKHLHRTYQCHICNKPSKNRVALDQHIRNVHKGRPNNKMCHHCGKGFPTKVQLDSHIRTHTGERPFICEFCPTTFSQQSNLYKHNRQVHLNIKSKRYPMCKKRKDDKPEAPPELPQHPDPYRPVAVLHYSPERGLIM